MMRRIAFLLAGLIVVLVLAGVGIWLAQHLESYQKMEKSGLSSRAKRNPFLAAHYFLQRTGIPTHSVAGRNILYQLPAHDDTLLVADFNIGLSPIRQQKFRQWIQQGGHVITTAPKFNVEPETNPLKQMFGIEAVVEKRIKGKQLLDDKPILMPVLFEGSDKQLQVEINPRFWLKYDKNKYKNAIAIRVQKKLRGIQIKIGKGELTVISDLDFLKNNRIGDHDHAFVLWNLVEGSRQMWILYSNHSPPLWIKAWKYNTALFVSVLMLGLLFFWSLWYRFGPIIRDNSAARRDILEHLHAAGRYQWRLDQAQQLLQLNRQEIRQTIARRYPAWRSLDSTAQIEWLAQQMNIPRQQLALALQGTPNNEAEFLRITRILQQIRSR